MSDEVEEPVPKTPRNYSSVPAWPQPLNFAADQAQRVLTRLFCVPIPHIVE